MVWQPVFYLWERQSDNFFSSIELNRIGRMKGRQTPHLIHLAFRSIDQFDGGDRTQADSRWMVVDGLEPRLNVTN